MTPRQKEIRADALALAEAEGLINCTPYRLAKRLDVPAGNLTAYYPDTDALRAGVLAAAQDRLTEGLIGKPRRSILRVVAEAIALRVEGADDLPSGLRTSAAATLGRRA